MNIIEYNTDNNNKLDDLMIMGREKRRSNIYKYVMGSNKTNNRRKEFHRVGPVFLNALEFREVLLEFWEILRGAFW